MACGVERQSNAASGIIGIHAERRVDSLTLKVADQGSGLRYCFLQGGMPDYLSE